MERIVVLDRATIASHIRIRRPEFQHEWIDHPASQADEVAQRIGNASIVVVNKVRLNRENLAPARQLKLIALAATGTDNVDLDYCAERGIVVSNIRGYAVHSVPEHTFALILALSRNLIGYRQDVHHDAWSQSGQFCFFNEPLIDLHGKTLGVYGRGSIGQAVARLGRAFGMHTMFAGHKGRGDMGAPYTPFEQVVETADIHTLHCPLLPATRNMIDQVQLRRMKATALVINAARGGLVVEEDLAKALREGWIAGAALDVLSREPPPSGHPMVELSKRRNFILTPHTAWAGSRTMQTLADQLIDNLEAFVAGTPRNTCT